MRGSPWIQGLAWRRRAGAFWALRRHRLLRAGPHARPRCGDRRLVVSEGLVMSEGLVVSEGLVMSETGLQME
jgi:hypothetical protein